MLVQVIGTVESLCAAFMGAGEEPLSLVAQLVSSSVLGSCEDFAAAGVLTSMYPFALPGFAHSVFAMGRRWGGRKSARAGAVGLSIIYAVHGG